MIFLNTYIIFIRLLTMMSQKHLIFIPTQFLLFYYVILYYIMYNVIVISYNKKSMLNQFKIHGHVNLPT